MVSLSNHSFNSLKKSYRHEFSYSKVEWCCVILGQKSFDLYDKSQLPKESNLYKFIKKNINKRIFAVVGKDCFLISDDSFPTINSIYHLNKLVEHKTYKIIKKYKNPVQIDNGPIQLELF